MLSTLLSIVFADFDLSSLFGDPLRASIGVQGAAFALAAVGLNLHYGFTGLLNVGVVAFMAAGSYGMAIYFTQTLPQCALDNGEMVACAGSGSGWQILVGVLVGLLFATVIALLVGLPALRLRADYLAIVTIAIGEVMRIAFRSARLEGLTGGAFGLPRLADRSQDISLGDNIGRFWNPLFSDDDPTRKFGFWRLEFDAKTLWIMIIGWGLVVITSLLVWALINSPWGRVIKAIREDEDAARALGKNVFSYKLQSLIIGGCIGALAGMIRTWDLGIVETQQFRPQTTFFIWTVLILGGAASKWGPVLGSLMFWFVLLFVEGLLRQLSDNGWIPEAILDPKDIGRVRFIMMGIMLAALMIWRPQGVLGKKEEALLDAA